MFEKEEKEEVSFKNVKLVSVLPLGTKAIELKEVHFEKEEWKGVAANDWTAVHLRASFCIYPHECHRFL